MVEESPLGKRAPRVRHARGQGILLRTAILDAALEIVAETGSARDLTLRRVAREVGIAATSVYLHFPDIGSLAQAVVDTGFERLDARRAAAADERADPFSALQARSRAYGDFAVENPGLYRVMFDGDRVNSGNGEFVSETGRASFDSLVESISRCRPEASDERRLALLLWSSLHGLALLTVTRPQLPWPPLHEQIDQLVRLLVTS